MHQILQNVKTGGTTLETVPLPALKPVGVRVRTAASLIIADTEKMLIEQLAQGVGRPVDLVDLQATQSPIVGQVLRHGRRLFREDTALYAELMKRWILDQVDWMPLRLRILTTRRTGWTEH